MNLSAARLVNRGLIVSRSGEVSINAAPRPPPASAHPTFPSITVINTARTIQAPSVAIRVASATASADIALLAGDRLSTRLDRESADGAISAADSTISGCLNSGGRSVRVCVIGAALTLGRHVIAGEAKP